VTRTFLLACLFCCVSFQINAWHNQSVPPAQTKEQTTTPPPSNPPATSSGDEENPPEEDESIAPEKFVLNPLESERNVKVGNYYMHRKKFIAAAQRYERATKYNPSSPEAFFKLGEAEEKLKHMDVARSCFRKVMQLAPESKIASEAKKKIGNKG
jgi:tetratricopeptide (TPR) repeat protein